LCAPIAPVPRLVAVVVAAFATHDGRNARPALATVAALTGLSRSTVQRMLARLMKDGWLAVQEPASRHDPTVYSFPLDAYEHVVIPVSTSRCPVAGA
jgi:DNA-binding IclR family transcriptional regulator